VSQNLVDNIFQCAKDFFALESAEKAEVHFKKSKILRGYEPTKEVQTDATKKSSDLNEAFNWGYSKELDPLAPNDLSGNIEEPDTPMTGPNAWPRMPGFKPKCAAYYAEVLSLGRRLVQLFALVLNLPEHHFDKMFSHPGAMGRLIHYPPQSPTEQSAFGIGAHTDIECFTILAQGEQPALQILNTDGEWLSAPPIPGTFVVNIGDMLSFWSNETFVSTVHRVLNLTGEERYSIPFFMGPSYDTVVEPLESCIRDGEKKYDSVLAGDYVYRRLAKSRLSEADYKTEMFKKDAIAAA